MSYQPPALFVAWRDPDSRRIFPVGRLLRLVTPFPGYEFGYIEGTRVAGQHGFQPFLAFPSLTTTYRSRELLPFFKNRVLSPSRPDYPEYVAALALDSAVEPMTLLAVSGGRRTTDLVELFPDWIRDLGSDRIHTRFLLRGVRHVQGAEARVEALRIGEHLRWTQDVENAVNPRAVLLRTEDGAVIGYVPDYLAADVSELIEHETTMDVLVERVNPLPAPRHLRVLCSLSATAPPDDIGFKDPMFRPLAPEATSIDDRAHASTPAIAIG